jgi:hypothetical protein
MTAPTSEDGPGLGDTIDAQADDGYRVWTTDLLTGRALCHTLPIALDNYEYGVVNAAGPASGVVSLDIAEDPQLTLAERRTALWVEHHGRVVWGGIVWDTDPDIAARELRIAAMTWSSYFANILIRNTLIYRNTSGGVDQLDVFRALVAYAQAKTHANIGVTVDPTVSGVLITQLFGPGAGDAGRPDKPVGEAMRELAEADPGFEWTDDVADDGASTNPGKRIRLGYPRITSGGSATGLTFNHPGEIDTYTWTKSGTNSPNTLYAIGAGDGPNQLVESAENADELSIGYPLLEASTGGDHKEVVRRVQLAARARADLAALTGGKLAPVFTIAGDAGPQPGDFGAGDTIRCRLTSAYHRERPDGSPGYDGYFRVTGVKVTPLRADQAGSMAVAAVPAGIA